MEVEMKKLFVAITFLFLAVFTVACDRTQKEEEKATKFLTYLESTIDLYENSNSGNLLIEVEAEELTTLEYIYNYSDSSLESLLCVLERDESLLAAYVKDKVSYMNINNEKTQTPLTSAEETTIVENYGFSAMTSSIFVYFDQSLFNAFTITSNADNKVVLTWDPSKYILITEGLEGDEYIAANDRYYDVVENIKAVVLVIYYEDELVTKLESTWTKVDNSIGSINISFRGTGVQTIDYPSDLNAYQQQD